MYIPGASAGPSPKSPTATRPGSPALRSSSPRPLASLRRKTCTGGESFCCWAQIQVRRFRSRRKHQLSRDPGTVSNAETLRKRIANHGLCLHDPRDGGNTRISDNPELSSSTTKREDDRHVAAKRAATCTARWATPPPPALFLVLPALALNRLDDRELKRLVPSVVHVLHPLEVFP